MSNPQHLIPISPESLAIAETYLSTQSVSETAKSLKISESQVSEYLDKPEVKRFVDRVYLEAGYRNRFRLAEVVDQLIETKLAELSEAGIGSSKDILEILQFAHKIRLDELNLQAKLEAARVADIKSQTNIQINSPYGDTNYGKLLDTLLNVEHKPK